MRDFLSHAPADTSECHDASARLASTKASLHSETQVEAQSATQPQNRAISRLRSFGIPAARIALFSALLIASALVGKIPLPGNPVGVTLQTFILMMTALTLSRAEAAASVASYLVIGFVGFPVFSGGVATAAFFGPSAGYLLAFLPAVAVTASLKVTSRRSHPSAGQAALMLLQNFAATLLGCVLLPLLLGVPVQSLLTGVSLQATFAVSSPFIVTDVIKAVVACLVCTAAQLAAARLSSQNAVASR